MENLNNTQKSKSPRGWILMLVVAAAIAITYKFFKTDPLAVQNEKTHQLEEIIASDSMTANRSEKIPMHASESNSLPKSNSLTKSNSKGSSNSGFNPTLSFESNYPSDAKAGAKIPSPRPIGAPTHEKIDFDQQIKSSQDSDAKKSTELSEKRLLTDKQVQELREQAKAHLSRAYLAQKSYYAKHGRYSTDLRATGWFPHQPRLSFKAGFISAFNPDDFDTPKIEGEDPKKMDTDFYEGTLFFNSKKEFNNQYYAYTTPAKSINLLRFEKFCRRQCTANSSSFEMIMVVPLGSLQNVDVWTVNNRKEIRLVNDGFQRTSSL